MRKTRTSPGASRDATATTALSNSSNARNFRNTSNFRSTSNTRSASDTRDARALVLYLVVAFLAAGALGAVQPATRIPGEVVELTQFGPALGVALAALLWPDRVRALLTGAADPPGGRPTAGRAVLLVATAPLIIVASVLAHVALAGQASATGTTAPFVLIAWAQLVGACGEEIGWRCFLQPLARTRFGPLGASVTVGLVWGLWHVPVLAEHPAYAGAFLVATVSMSVVLGWALEGMGVGRLPLAAGFHALINLGMLLFLDEESGAVLPMALLGGSCLVAAAAWTWANVRRPASARIAPVSNDVP